MRSFMYVWLMAIGLFGPVVAPAHAANYNDSIVAVVSTTVISGQELNQRVALTLRQLGGESKLSEADKKFIENKSLVLLIDEELQRQFAQSNRIMVSSDELARYRADIEKQGLNLSKLGAGGFESALKRKLEAELRWQKIIALAVRPSVFIPPSEVDQIVNAMLKNKQVVEREISQILLAVADRSNESSQQAKVHDIETKLKEGADFAELAKQFSDDDSAKNGGKMGWFTAGELNPQLEEALDKLKPGEVSGVIRTPLGWHLVRLDNTRNTKPIDDNPENMNRFRDRAREHLTASKVELESRRLMRELRQRAFVDIRR